MKLYLRLYLVCLLFLISCSKKQYRFNALPENFNFFHFINTHSSVEFYSIPIVIKDTSSRLYKDVRNIRNVSKVVYESEKYNSLRFTYNNHKFYGSVSYELKIPSFKFYAKLTLSGTTINGERISEEDIFNTLMVDDSLRSIIHIQLRKRLENFLLEQYQIDIQSKSYISKIHSIYLLDSSQFYMPKDKIINNMTRLNYQKHEAVLNFLTSDYTYLPCITAECLMQTKKLLFFDKNFEIIGELNLYESDSKDELCEGFSIELNMNDNLFGNAGNFYHSNKNLIKILNE